MIFYIPEYGLYIVMMHQAIQVVSVYAVHQIIVQAVCYMHRKNPVVHYDLKPRNVLVCNNYFIQYYNLLL